MKKISNKKINKKGFTLVELLAVIVILAILILLAMPQVLKIMESARQDAFATEVRSYLKAAQQKYVETSMLKDGPVTCYSRTDDTTYSSKQGSQTAVSGSSAVKIDMDDKEKYKYIIKLTEDPNTNAITYTYTIFNGIYYATAKDVSMNADVTVVKDDKVPTNPAPAGGTITTCS